MQTGETRFSNLKYVNYASIIWTCSLMSLFTLSPEMTEGMCAGLIDFLANALKNT